VTGSVTIEVTNLNTAATAVLSALFLGAPTTDPGAAYTTTAGQPLAVTLPATDSGGHTVTYTASAETQPYWLEQTDRFYEDAGGYHTSYRGQQEKYLRATVSVDNYDTGGIDPWYYILPDGDLYEFTPPFGNPALVGVLVAHLGTAVYDDPSLLWNAQNAAVPATVTVAGNQLTITASSSYAGTFVVAVSASQGVTTSGFTVTVYPPPTLAAVPSQTVAPGQSLAIRLDGSDPDGDALSYTATAETPLYWLEQTDGFYEDAGGYYTDYRGQQEKYLRAAVSAEGYDTGGGDAWYYLMPNGDLYEFTPPFTDPALVGALVAHLGVGVYNDPSLLWNAANTTVPVTLAVLGNRLTITPDTGSSGAFVVLASASDGANSARVDFTVVVLPSATLALAPITDQTAAAGQPLSLPLQASDPGGEALSFTVTAEAQLYWLDQAYGFYEDAGGYYTNYRGQQEKYLRAPVSAGGFRTALDPWYSIQPNGDLYEFTPPYSDPALVGVLVAHLGTAAYDDPSLLTGATNVAPSVSVSVTGNRVTITPASGYAGTFVVTATVTDGPSSASRSFTVNVPADTVALYYSAAGQVLEERLNGTASADVSHQYVWSQAYVNALVLRDDYAGGVLVPSDRLYAQQDANFNTTALVDTSGAVVERYTYSPYGQVTILDPSGTPRAGNVSAFGWQYLFQGGRVDAITGWYRFGARDYVPADGAWAERDPLGLAAGDLNEYRFVQNTPFNALDPSGLLDEPPGGWNWPLWDGTKAIGWSVLNNTVGWIIPLEIGNSFESNFSERMRIAQENAAPGSSFNAEQGSRANFPGGEWASGDLRRDLAQAATSGSGALGGYGPGIGASGAARTAASKGRTPCPSVGVRGPKGITTPSPKLRQWAQQGGYIDPRTNTFVSTAERLAADHVYPKSLIEGLPRFGELSTAQREWLLNYPGNFEPLPKSWNSSKLNLLADEWATTPMGQQVSTEYISALRERQQAFEGFAQNMIDFWLGQ
jgi:RHS repeat-associated protein